MELHLQLMVNQFVRKSDTSNGEPNTTPTSGSKVQQIPLGHAKHRVLNPQELMQKSILNSQVNIQWFYCIQPNLNLSSPHFMLEMFYEKFILGCDHEQTVFVCMFSNKESSNNSYFFVGIPNKLQFTAHSYTDVNMLVSDLSKTSCSAELRSQQQKYENSNALDELLPNYISKQEILQLKNYMKQIIYQRVYDEKLHIKYPDYQIRSFQINMYKNHTQDVSVQPNLNLNIIDDLQFLYDQMTNSAGVIYYSREYKKKEEIQIFSI